MSKELDDRYQNQTRLVRAYRWLRWMPLCYLEFAWKASAWVAGGAKPLVDPHWGAETRRKTLSLIWACVKAKYECSKMQFYYTMDEVFRDLADGNETD